MRLGHLLYQPTPDMAYSHHERLQETLELTRLADELRFDTVTFGENHFSNYGYSPNPVMLAAAIGQHTEHLVLATGVAVLPFWNPIRLAEDIAVADNLLNGRLEICIGRGYQKLEFEGLNIPIAERQERYEEALEIIQLAWTTDDLTYDGKHYQITRPINVLPKPYQKPHPTITVAGVTEESIRAAAATDFKVFGTSWETAEGSKSAHEIYLDERQRIGREGDHWVYAANRQIFVIDSSSPTEYGRRRQEVLLRSREATRLGAGLRAGTIGYDRGKVTSHPIDGERELEDYARSMIFGTPDEVLEQVRALRDITGIQEINIMTEFGGCDYKLARRSIELFGKEVLPALREDDAP